MGVGVVLEEGCCYICMFPKIKSIENSLVGGVILLDVAGVFLGVV